MQITYQVDDTYGEVCTRAAVHITSNMYNLYILAVQGSHSGPLHLWPARLPTCTLMTHAAIGLFA